VGRVAAGEVFSGLISPGSCVRIFTGSPLPRGADAVVMQEDTRVSPDEPGGVLVLAPAKLWENIRLRGEDLKSGAILAQAGDLLTAGRIMCLAAAGCSHFRLNRAPRVGLLATGSELREPGQSLLPGQIYESNRVGLASLCRGVGAIPEILPLVHDELDATCQALAKAFGCCDVVVTSGGVSVGEMDFVKEAFQRIDGKLEFWKVAIRPGRPFMFGRREGKFLFGLPGNPVSALVTFLLLVRPALLRWQGASNLALSKQTVVLEEPLINYGQRRHFMRVTVNSEGKARSAGLQASHVLSSVASANGLVDVPPNTVLPAGAGIPVLRWE
jgi:molybdopterin molybdotransferase